MNKLIETLSKKAAEKTHLENDPDYFPGEGGNYDDAHWDGQCDGQIKLSRELLKLLDE